jgi:excisionase family DNA binding protein
MIKDAITTIEAAGILGLDPSAIRHMIRRGKLAFEKRGRDNYVSKATIQQLKIAKATRAKKNGSKKVK